MSRQDAPDRQGLWTPTGRTTPADHEAGQRLKNAVDAALRCERDEDLRHPVLRTGQRPEIPLHVRFAVYMRDGDACCACKRYVRDTEKNLDHIKPWSAGGSDRSTNLRTLCPPCNQARSNYRDDALPKQPVTWWCTDCWTYDHPRHATWTAKIYPDDPAWRSRLPFVNAALEDLTLAFCAFCGRGGYTDRPL